MHVYIHTLHTYVTYIYVYIQTQCFFNYGQYPRSLCLICPWISTGPCSLPGIGGGKVQGTERISVAAVGNPGCHQGIPSGDSSHQPFMVILWDCVLWDLWVHSG